jgi:hypothetical protein
MIAKIGDAGRRLASYRQREGGEFTFADEFVSKRRELAEVEKALAEDVEEVGGGTAMAA